MLITFFPMVVINFGDILYAMAEPFGKIVIWIFLTVVDAIVWIWGNVIVKSAEMICRAA